MNHTVLLKSIVITFIPALVGGVATASSVTTWYAGLKKAPLNPPNWVFGPVWTILYLMQGISLYLINITPTEPDKIWLAKIFFYGQLILNLAWTLLFFGLRNPKLGLIEIGLLIIFVAFSIISAGRISKLAALLLAPYFIWICFASYFNFMVVQLNR